MRPLFTIHAGEYLVGDFLERTIKECDIWVPSKDSGIDLLITNKKNRKYNAAIQVKFSKDFLPQMKANYHENLLACGWWTLNREKIQMSDADYWVLTPYSFFERKAQYIIIEPKELLARLDAIHGIQKSINVYLWITKDGKCIETRDFTKEDQDPVLIGDYSNIIKERNFTKYLNNWKKIYKGLKIST